MIDALVFVTMDELMTVRGVAEPAPMTTAERVAAVYDLHQRELFSFALRSSRDHELAEDLVQEAFMRLIVEIEAGREPANVRAWLYRVTANLNISRARRAAVAQRQASGLIEQDAEPGPEPSFLDTERRTILETALGELGDDARTALVMAANGFSGMEIAEAIGRTGLATRTLMCRARLQLRERLGSHEALA